MTVLCVRVSFMFLTVWMGKLYVFSKTNFRTQLLTTLHGQTAAQLTAPAECRCRRSQVA